MLDEDFRRMIRGFIAGNLPPEIARRTLLRYHSYKPDVVFWTRKLHERGWSVPNWPIEHGGPGWTISQRHIFDEECFAAGCPIVSPQGLHLVGPIIYTFGDEAQKRRFLPPIRSGEHLWGQGFSEPNAGSDLAALQTRAVREGGHYIVNGQKIWTSEVHYSEWLFLLVRTAEGGKPQAGISFLLVDMATPGITVRPIVSIDGGHVLNEVFLDDVHVPVENLVGEENMGWTYAKTLLGAERTFSAEVARCRGLLRRLRDIAGAATARGRALVEDPHFARRLAQLEIDVLAQEATLRRAVAEEEAEFLSLAPTSSTLKVKGTELVQRVGALMVEALGDDALPFYPESDILLADRADLPGNPRAHGVVSDFFYRRAATIYGGTNEIQRTIIASELLKNGATTSPYIADEVQSMLRDSARRWVETRDVRAAEPIADSWRHFAEMGWLAAAIPDAAGGLGETAHATAIVAEALGRGLIRAPFVEVAGVAATLLAAVAPDRLAALGAGEHRPILAHDEPDARGEPDWIETRAIRDGGGWRLTGRKSGVIGGPLADVLIVTAIAEGEGPSLFEIAAADAPLWRFTTFDDRPAGELRLDAHAATSLGKLGDAMPHVRLAVDHALVLESAEALGAMQRALEITRDYLLTRRQFGQAIGDFQALRHRLADMFIEVEQARSIVAHALDVLTSGDARGASRVAAAAKARVAQAGVFVTGQAIQLHGGIGMTEECAIGHYFKRLVAFDQRHGGSGVQVERFAEFSGSHPAH